MSIVLIPRTGLPQFYFAALLGVVFGMATTYSAFWPLQMLALACFFGLLLGQGARACAASGYAFGMGWFVSSFWWLYISMHVYGGMPGWMAAVAVLLLSAFLALFPALASYVCCLATQRLKQNEHVGKTRRNMTGLSIALSFAAAWMLQEWLRNTLFTGFPWNATAYGHVDSPFAAIASLAGVDGIHFVVAFFAALLAIQISRILSRDMSVNPYLLLAITSILIGVYGFSAWLNPHPWSRDNEAAPKGLQVALIQGNVPQDLKFDPETLHKNIDLHLRMLLEARGDLIVTPETVVPLPPERLPDGMLLSISDALRSKESAALLGVVLTTPNGGYTNSALGFNLGTSGESQEPMRSPKGQARAPAQYRYDKYHLVPFGEFIPYGFRWFVDMMHIPLGDFTRGTKNASAFELKGERIAPTICYEDVFGDELRARFTDEATAPTMFANLTNLAWFGDTFALDQHLAIARMRSIEFARPSVRATNTGATVVIDHQGKVTHELKRFTQGTLNASVHGRVGLTPYARFGSAWLLILAGVWLLWCICGQRKPST